MMKRCLMFFALCLGISGQASAEDFNGPSIGVQGGWNSTDVRRPGTSDGVPGVDRSTDSFVGGGFLAYDYKVTPRIVIGAQAEFNLAASDDFDATSDTGQVRIDPRYSFDLSARLGFLATPETLIYLRGGYSNARIRTSTTAGSKSATSTHNRDGWMAGGGVERVIADHVTARLEYRYADLGEGPGKFDRHQVLVGAAYHF